MKKIVSILLAMLMIMSLAGCDSGDEITDISYFVSSLPKSIDPQIASTPEELCIVRNIFEGLTRIDKNGKTQLAAAKNYKISSDRLTYTFYLKEDLTWSDSTPLTAYDFEFGIKRAADPATKASSFMKIAVIKGAEDILNGASDISNLGVRALDNHTLEIILKEPCLDFLDYLAEPVFMPCNEEFFKNTSGKYGLDKKNTLSNGAYMLSGWKPEKNYISFKKSKNYSGVFSCDFDSVLLQTSGADTLSTDFNEGKIHIISSNCNADISALSSASTIEIENATCLLYINKELLNEAMLSAFKGALNIQAVAETMGKSAAYSYIPNSAIYGDIIKYLISSINPPYNHKYDPETAYTTFVSELSGKEYKGNFPKSSIIYANEKGVDKIAQKIAAGWQTDLGVFINIEPKSTNEIINNIAAGDFMFALIPIKSATGNAADYLASISDLGLQISNPDFTFKVLSIASAENDSEYKKRIDEAEMMVLSTDNIIPICHLSDKYYCNSAISEKLKFINGAFDFVSVQ